MEEYTKYNNQQRFETNPLIDEPAIVILGLTLSEMLITIAMFPVMAFFNQKLLGLVATLLAGYLLPRCRERLKGGLMEHALWSIGFIKPKFMKRLCIFSQKQRWQIYGP